MYAELGRPALERQRQCAPQYSRGDIQDAHTQLIPHRNFCLLPPSLSVKQICKMAAISTSRTALVGQRVAVAGRVAKVCSEAAIVSTAIWSYGSCSSCRGAKNGWSGHLGCPQYLYSYDNAVVVYSLVMEASF